MTRALTHRDLTLTAVLMAIEDAEQQAFIADQHAARLAPSNAVRPLLDHELAAQTRFADLEDDRDAAVAEAEALLAGLQADVKSALLTGLFGEDPDGELTPEQAVAVIHELSTQQPEQVTESESSILLPLAGIFAAAYLLSGRRVIEEAERQGAPVPTVTPAELPVEDFQAAAQAVTTHPWRRISGKLEEELTSQATIAQDTISRADVERVLDDIKIDGSRDQARQAINQASGTGRIDTIDQAPAGELEPSQIWASAIMDGQACDPCGLMDGREFSDMAEARLHFPNGQYTGCRGSARCRCTLVYLMAS